VTQAALFHRAGSKEALMLRALCPGAPEVVAVLAEGPSTAPLREQLTRVLSGLSHFLEVAVPGLVLLRGAGVPLEKAIPPGPPPPLAMRGVLTGFLSAAAARGLTSLVEPGVTADALLSVLEARALNRYLGGSAFVAGDDATLISSMVGALVPEGQPS
jgi:hypothetical protein